MTERQPVRIPGGPRSLAPYSVGMRSGSLLFTAGQVGVDPGTGRLVEGGAAAEAAQALDNLRAVLEAGGSGLDRVLRTGIFLVSMDDFSAVNEVYARLMPEPYPARTTVAVQALPLGARIEIEMVAAAEPRGV
ncbi:MAG TPA: Rid family detoxifying hydrolase [Candidatus Limnocylindria bacterium]|nr:Rid family detoxifying hydrolase [Candidatus Limnocylindria bacterium]